MTEQDLVPITETAALEAACEALKPSDFLCVDTEFHRETTYYPKLCLVQVSGEGCEFIIDPLAEGIDLKPFLDLLMETSRTKVFHAARQDMDIFVEMAGAPPAPIFDTQIAAMALGLGDSISYDNLISRLTGAKIDKSSQFTDWQRRPLTQKQLHYALGDVTHLRDAYLKMREMLDSQSRMDWVRTEMAVYEDPELYNADPKNAWQRLKVRRPRKDYLAVLTAVAAWREELAQTLDKPRRRILKDDAIQEIAEQRPVDAKSMDRLRAVPTGFGKSRHGESLLTAIRDAINDPDAYAPNIPREPQRNPAPPGATDMLKVLLKTVSDDRNVVPRLIANAADLEAIAQGRISDTAVGRGWRYELFGKRAEALLDGHLAVRFRKGEVEFFETE
jgi:ribonuclease D